jgi:hypothetical protein
VARAYLVRTKTGFEPADEPSREICSKFKVGDAYRAEIVKPRSYAHHKMIFALLNLTYENQDRYDNFESFRKAVAMAAGHTEELVTLHGEIVRLPKSLSYEALDEIEFTKIAAEMMTVCCSILGDIGAHELEAEVSRYASNNYGRAA